MKGVRISKEDKKDILRRIEAGENEEALAEEYKLCRKTILRIQGRRKSGSGERMSLEWRAAFQASWANIYPGDEERMRRQKEVTGDEMRAEISGS